MLPQNPAAFQAQPKLTYVDRPDIPETFAHSVRRLWMDAGNIHFELVTNRLDDPAPDKQMTGTSVTVARLVMPINGAAGLQSSIGALMQTLQSHGVVKPVSSASTCLN